MEIYFKDLTHVTTEVGKSKDCSVGRQAGKSVLSFRSKDHLLTEFLLARQRAVLL